MPAMISACHSGRTPSARPGAAPHSSFSGTSSWRARSSTYEIHHRVFPLTHGIVRRHLIIGRSIHGRHELARSRTTGALPQGNPQEIPALVNVVSERSFPGASARLSAARRTGAPSATVAAIRSFKSRDCSPGRFKRRIGGLGGRMKGSVVTAATSGSCRSARAKRAASIMRLVSRGSERRLKSTAGGPLRIAAVEPDRAAREWRVERGGKHTEAVAGGIAAGA